MALEEKAKTVTCEAESYIFRCSQDDQDVHDDHDAVPDEVKVEPPGEGAEADDDHEHDVDDVPREVDATPNHHPLFHVLQREIVRREREEKNSISNLPHRSTASAALGGPPAT